jgi:hypothetical protein
MYSRSHVSYTSRKVSTLTKTGMQWQTLVKISNIKFHENPFIKFCLLHAGRWEDRPNLICIPQSWEVPKNETNNTQCKENDRKRCAAQDRTWHNILPFLTERNVSKTDNSHLIYAITWEEGLPEARSHFIWATLQGEWYPDIKINAVKPC